jgi:hypothetical protein
MKKFNLAVAIFALSGCQTLSFGGGSSVTTIDSDPTDAHVTVEGYGECDTPCTVGHDVDRMVTVAKAGYKPQRFVIKPGSKRVRVVLEKSAPTKDVESITLPEL